MSTVSTILSITLPVLALVFSFFVGLRTMKRTGSGKKAFNKHLFSLAGMLVFSFAFTLAAGAATGSTADAATAVSAAASSGIGLATGLGFIAAALSIGISAIGAGIALSGSAPAAIGANAEDPKTFGKSMVFVVLGEAVAIYGLIIAFLIILKIPNIPSL